VLLGLCKKSVILPKYTVVWFDNAKDRLVSCDILNRIEIPVQQHTGIRPNTNVCVHRVIYYNRVTGCSILSSNNAESF